MVNREDHPANSNFKTLNVIFAVISVTKFKLISACESVKILGYSSECS